MFAYLSASINYACNIYNWSGSDFMAIGNLSSIILVWQEFDGRQKKWKKWFKKTLLAGIDIQVVIFSLTREGMICFFVKVKFN